MILQVYGLVRSIPVCRVTTYGKHFGTLSVRSYNIYSGHIAKLAGMPNHSRHVGQGKRLKFGFGYEIDFSLSPALKFLPANTQPPIPWHRVIGTTGTISSRGPGTDGARRRRDALVAEGVDVIEGLTGAFKVDLGGFLVCNW